ncbi:hypothetical protein D9613_007531 [Agrocybe pediades]|uniref:Uncharacterized protein n=1 Tax=Agrocybe pediades TaxID=84607 RepID=A0A8H4QN79_9AGAR|nr:hypothetical protein D9613_007531 [Agrocybe pediades]
MTTGVQDAGLILKERSQLPEQELEDAERHIIHRCFKTVEE